MAGFSKLRTIPSSCHQYFHPYDPSCTNTATYLTKDALLESFRIYCMAYLVGLVVRRKIPTRRDIRKTLLGILQSTAFLTTNASAFSVFVCLLRQLFGSYNFLTVSFLPAFLASYVAINVERGSRRSLLCLYVTNVASETLFRMAVARKLVKPIRYGEVFIFSMSVAQLLFNFRTHHDASDPIYSFLRFLVGPYEERGHECPITTSEQMRERRYSGKNPVLKAYTQLVDNIKSYIDRAISPSIHPACPHPHSCPRYALNDVGRLFLVGYAIQFSLKLILHQRKVWKTPALIYRLAFSPDTMRLGGLFSSFSTIFKVMMCFLRRRAGHDDAAFAYPAGVMAGVSFLLFRDNTIALYFLWKTLHVMYTKAISNGRMYEVPYGTEILYSLSTAVLFHAGVLEPDNLRPSYWRFLKAISGNRLEKLDRRVLEEFGFGTLKQLNLVISRESRHK